MKDGTEARVKELCERNRERFLEILNHCHKHPETAFEEFETTKYIKSILDELGIELISPFTETGAVALLKGGKPGPCIALRADIDALPVREQSSAEIKSLNEGRMHACGHDTHYGSLLCSAILLSELREEITGSVKFIFQPAEEIGKGAKLQVTEGCLENPHVDAIFSFHNSPEIPTGSVAVIHGPIMASVDNLEITLKGKGGHGGIPHRNTDPIVAMASLLQALQTVVSRNVSPIDSGVISVCSVQAGEYGIYNVIPDTVKMFGTVRAYRQETAQLMERRIKELAEGIASAYNCEAEVVFEYHLPVTDNRPVDGHRDMYDIALKAVEAAGARAVEPEPSGGGDDFSIFMLGYDGHPGTAGFFYWLGVRNEDKDCCYSWHSPKFRADPEAITYGASLLTLSALLAGDTMERETE